MSFHGKKLSVKFSRFIVFCRYTKTEDSQLAWCFVRCPQTVHFPLGVKTMYKAYVSNEIYEFMDDKESVVGTSPTLTKCRWEPKTDVGLSVSHDGMFILTKLPETIEIPVAAFQDKHLKDFEDTFNDAVKIFRVGTAFETIHNDWIVFKKFFYPSSEIVSEYLLTENGFLSCPLKSQLFRTCSLPSYVHKVHSTAVELTPVSESLAESASYLIRNSVSTCSVRHNGIVVQEIPSRFIVSAEQQQQYYEGSLSGKALYDAHYLMKLDDYNVDTKPQLKFASGFVVSHALVRILRNLF
jgi:hypothetical protein